MFNKLFGLGQGSGQGNYQPPDPSESFQPKFKVEIQDLGELVKLATSGQRGEYKIGEIELPSPLTGVQIVLHADRKSDGGHDGYRLESNLNPSPRQKLGFDLNYFESFEADRNSFNENLFSLKSSKLKNIRDIYMKTGLYADGGVDLGHFVAYGDRLSEQEVGTALTVYATAIEELVNGVYKNAKVQSPETTLYLSAGGKVERIGQRASPETARSGSRNYGSQQTKDSDEAKATVETLTSTLTFENIGGYQDVKDRLTMWMNLIKNPEMAKEYGVSPQKGTLLAGPPGTGKTTFGKAVAGETGAKFMYVDATSLIQKYVGDSPKAFKEEVFEKAGAEARESKQPVFLFIDEVDTVLRKRDTERPVQGELVSVWNQYMDGALSSKIDNVYVIAATNKPELLDEAAVRPPRFRRIDVPLPDLEGITAILNVRTQDMEKESGKILFNPEIDYNSLSEHALGLSGADLSDVLYLVREAAFEEGIASGSSEPRQTTYEELLNALQDRKQKPDEKSRRGIGFRPNE